MIAIIQHAQASGAITPPFTFFFQGCGGPSVQAEPACDCLIASAGPSYGNKRFAYTSATTATCYYQDLNTGSWFGGNISGWPVSTCPSNSTWNAYNDSCTCIDPNVPDSSGTSCVPFTCENGYQTNPAGTGCIPNNNCPANMAGNPCACNENYAPNPAGAGCVLEQYSIALHGLGVTVLPNTTLRTAYAQVTKSDGSPKSGAQVSLLLTVVPENNAPIRAEHVGRVSPNGGSTGSDGRLNFAFAAPAAGGTHTITASCPTCTNFLTEGTITVPGCPEPPLTELTDQVAIDFDNSVGGRWRPDRLTADYQNKLACVEREIRAKHGTSTGTSAYRPNEYQRHLYEVIKKDVKLDTDYMAAYPACRALRDEITHEMGPETGSPPGHHLQYDQPVARPSRSHHEAGEAFDLTPHGLTDAQMVEVYTTCHVTHIAVPTEPWHVQ